MALDKQSLNRKIKKIEGEHREELAVKKKEILDLKSARSSNNSDLVKQTNLQKTTKESLDTITKDIGEVRRDNGELKRQIKTLTGEKNSALKQIDDSLALRLQSQEKIASLNADKEY